MSKRSRLAAMTLVLSAAGSAATFPFQGSFTAALLHHGFLAATVGGMADWFAVTALFKKPLGISWRTEIIPRNYDRILSDLTEFFCRDLLSAENIMHALGKYHLAPLVFSYLKEPKGQALLSEALTDIFRTAAARMDLSAAENSLLQAAEEPVSQLHIPVILADAAAETLHRRADAPLTELLLEEAAAICRSRQMREILTSMLAGALENYKQDNIISRLVIHIPPEKLALETQNYLLQYFSLLRLQEHPQRRQLHRGLLDYVQNLRGDPEFIAWADKKIREFAYKNLPSLRSLLISASDEDLKEACRLMAEKLAVDGQLQQAAEPHLRRLLEKLLRENSKLPEELLKRKLQEFTPEKLVQYIEERVGDDLQMIRINGAVIGALAGMLLYTITWLAERMWG